MKPFVGSGRPNLTKIRYHSYTFIHNVVEANEILLSQWIIFEIYSGTSGIPTYIIYYMYMICVKKEIFFYFFTNLKEMSFRIPHYVRNPGLRSVIKWVIKRVITVNWAETRPPGREAGGPGHPCGERQNKIQKWVDISWRQTQDCRQGPRSIN